MADAALHLEILGRPEPAANRTERLVLLHGFTQTARCWGSFAADLARDREVVALDMPGHGGSSGVRADLDETAELVARTAGRGTYLGYSMGGRVALHVALDHPSVVERLVLVGATAGIEDDHERASRRASDEALADRLDTIGVDRFVDEWLEQPLFAGLRREDAAVPERRRNAAAGLSSSLRLAGTGTQRPRWGDLSAIEVPVLVLAGVDDPKFSALAGRLGRAIGPNATVALVPRSGHTVHLENPADTASIVRRWMRAHPPDDR
jgi:2-succinyl-6-hydroxy-2,4-cyclohexadiene-1-carboxylate synthase